MAIIRTFILGLLVYGAIVLCYPEWTGEVYHIMMVAVIAGGAVGVWFFNKVFDFGTGAVRIGVEAGFLLVVALFLGYTMPQKSGKAPFTQFAEGVRPTRDTARQGFDRLGVNPNGKVAAKIIEIFPKR